MSQYGCQSFGAILMHYDINSHSSEAAGLESSVIVISLGVAVLHNGVGVHPTPICKTTPQEEI